MRQKEKSCEGKLVLCQFTNGNINDFDYRAGNLKMAILHVDLFGQFVAFQLEYYAVFQWEIRNAEDAATGMEY